MVATRPYGERRAVRVLVAVPVVALIAIDAAYIAIIRSQGSPPPDNAVTVPFVSGYLLVMAALLAISLVGTAPIVTLRPALRGAAAAGLLVMGVLALFSIGLPIVISGALAGAATVVTLTAKPSLKATVSAVVAAAVSVALLAVGFEVSWNVIVCPATGQSGGTTASFFGTGKSYECNDGVLTVTSE